MSKRYFKIETGRYGGELCIGSISEDFVEYWKTRVKEEGDSDLIETLHRYEYDDEDIGDADSPAPDKNFYSWTECDNIEHVTGPYVDNQFTVMEIELHSDAEYVDGIIQWKEGIDHDYSTQMYEQITPIGDEEHHDYSSHIYGREVYSDAEPNKEHKHEPVLYFFSAEKGGFGDVFVETDGEDFDPEKLQIGIVESDLAQIIEAYWYDRKPLQIDFDYADTTGKGYYSTVGYLNTEWHDSQSDWVSYDMEETDRLKEAFDDHYHMMED